MTSSAKFVNGSEKFFAAILDHCDIKWEYEPETFVISTDKWGVITKAFTPDFYLPEVDLYIELTTMKASRCTRKNKKIKDTLDKYPHLNVVLLNKGDLDELDETYKFVREALTNCEVCAIV